MAEPIIVAESTGLGPEEMRILEGVRRILWEYEPLRASGSAVLVEFHNGALRLSGRVRTRALKEIATYLVRTVDGVASVENRLVSDPDVAQAVAGALALDAVTRPHVIRVEARLGRARLLGVVPSASVERRALEIAARVPLATGVDSELEVDPQVEAAPLGTPAASEKSDGAAG